MSPVARAADALLEASVVGSFSKIGISVRSRLLPEFSNGSGPPSAGRVAVITGATSGLGLAASRELAERGWTVYFLARSRDRAERARRTIAAAASAGRSGAGGTVGYGLADMEDQDSVRAFAREFRQAHDRLDVLVHAAGAIHQRFAVNHAGIELTVAGQLVTPFLLTKLLLPTLLAGAPSRVITVSSGGMYAQRLDPATLEMSPSGYRGAVAYARVKRAQVALSREWARRIDPAQVAFHAMHPGWADTPGIAAALPRFRRLALPILRTPEQGADTIVWLATAAPELLGSGCFWHDRRPRSEYLLPWTRERDPAAARHLWDSIDRTAGSLSGPGPASGPQGHDHDGRGGRPAGAASGFHGYADAVAAGQPGGQHWRGLPRGGCRQQARPPGLRRPHQPQLVDLARRQPGQPGRGKDDLPLDPGHHNRGGSAVRGRPAPDLSVRGGEDRGDRLVLSPRGVQLMPGAQPDGPERDGHGQADHGDGRGQPGRPGRAESLPRRPSWRPAGMIDDGGQLPGYRRGGQHPLLDPRRWRQGRGHAQLGRGVGQAADLVVARLAAAQVMLEKVPFQPIAGIQGVETAQIVQVMPWPSHEPTPMQSRSRIRPSRIRVLTVPRAVSSKVATCG